VNYFFHPLTEVQEFNHSPPSPWFGACCENHVIFSILRKGGWYTLSWTGLSALSGGLSEFLLFPSSLSAVIDAFANKRHEWLKRNGSATVLRTATKNGGVANVYIHKTGSVPYATPVAVKQKARSESKSNSKRGSQ
jgi:hypothetical protein